MNDDYEPWVDETLNSMAGSRRAQPSAHLLDRIEAQVFEETSQQKMTVVRWSRLAIAASLLLFINGWVLYQHVESSSSTTEQDSPYALVSNYNCYQ